MHKVIIGLFFLIPLAHGQEPMLKPLDDALWRGVLTLEVGGYQYTQYLANQNIKSGGMEFVKEKGQMEVGLKVQVEFLINALGDYELLAIETFNGKYSLTRQSRRQFREEVKQKRLTYKQKVQVSISRETLVNFDMENAYDRENFSIGSIRLLPSGRLDKKGSLTVEGEFSFDYMGEGSFTETWERQPASKQDPNKRKKGSVKKPYTLPLTFSFSTSLNRKPVNGNVTVTSDPATPFPTSDDNVGKSNIRNAITTQGSFQLTPLFSKKKK